MKEVESVSNIPFFGGNLGFNFMGDDVLIKTGYGLIKMLKNIIDESFKIDDKGNPCILIFNNYALNTHYVVEVMQSSFSQSVENNMIWYYNIEMKAVAPAEAVKRQDGNSDKRFIGKVAFKCYRKRNWWNFKGCFKSHFRFIKYRVMIETVVIEFQKVTKYPLIDFLTRYRDFMLNSYPAINRYFFRRNSQYR